MISPPVQSPNYRFLPLSHRAFVAWRMNMFNGVRYAVALWAATLEQVLGRKDPARLVPSILPYVHSYCHLNWVGSLCLPSHTSKAAWPCMAVLCPTSAHSTFLYGRCDRMEQAGAGHSTGITPKASCGTQLPRTSGAEPKRWRMSWETREAGLKQ